MTGLRAHSYSALIVDAPVLEYVTGKIEDCDLFLVGETFNAFSLALAFRAAFDDQIVYQFSRSIVKIQAREGKTGMFVSVMYGHVYASTVCALDPSVMQDVCARTL